MTGFARADGTAGAVSWHWEIRSVNGRGLDVRLRVAPGFEGMEARVREALTRRLVRGSVTVSLAIKRVSGQTQIQLNETALKQALVAIDRVTATVPVTPPSAEGLLGIKGVLEIVDAEESETEAQTRTEVMLDSFGQALDRLVEARREEGQRLQSVLNEQLRSIEKLVGNVERSPSRTPDAIKLRLKEQVGRLLEASTALDDTRLYQEAVLLATRADVEEELKRLTAHISAARQLLQSKEPVGRRLDFLAQEFNREANTLCSKSNDTDTTRAGLELKSVIDQMREQVQNIE